MFTTTRLFLLAATVAVMAGCDSSPPAGPPGKHLVYRDSQGNAIRQFDDPDDAFCRRVESAAGRGARCQADPAAGLGAQATLRYNPPGVIVHGHYADMARCRADTGTMSAGVEIVQGCATK
jgi:hypothetical protein